MKNQPQKTGRKPIFFILIPIILAAILITVTVCYSLLHITSDTIVGNINKMDIYAGEIKMMMTSQKANAIEHFDEQYNNMPDAEFWSTEIDGSTPEQYLRNLALESVARYKLEQQLGKKYGLVTDTSYKAFIAEITSVNLANSRKIASNEPVYGQKSYNLNTYYEYRLSNLQLDLQKKMSESGQPLYADEATLKAYFEQKKNVYYTNVDTYALKLISVDVTKTDIDTAKAILTNAAKLIKSKGYDSAAAVIKSKYKQAEFLSTTLNNDNASQMSKQSTDAYNAAIEMKKGDVSDILQQSEKLQIIYCSNRIDAGFMNYNEIKSTLTAQYSQEKYEVYINELMKKNKVQTNEKFDKIPVLSNLD